MSDSLIQIKCSQCGNEWHTDVQELKKQQYMMYKGLGQANDYRVTCGKCGTVFIVTVREKVKDD